MNNRQCSEFEITEAMIRHGGSFASQLGLLIRLADPENKRRLAEAFPELLDQYDELAVLQMQRVARDPQTGETP